jgi:hypothetical protein
MLSAILLVSGTFAVAHGSWRGWVAARAVARRLGREGDPTRALLEADRPIHARSRVRYAAHNSLVAVGWLAVALYGLYLATVGLEVAR